MFAVRATIGRRESGIANLLLRDVEMATVERLA